MKTATETFRKKIFKSSLSPSSLLERLHQNLPSLLFSQFSRIFPMTTAEKPWKAPIFQVRMNMDTNILRGSSMKSILWIFTLSMGLLVGGNAWAHQGLGQRPWPCQPDMEKFCQGIQPGGGRIMRCMRQHEGELSSACREILVRKMKHEKLGPPMCSSDAEKFCKGIDPQDGGLIRCLKEHAQDLSPDCKKICGNTGTPTASLAKSITHEDMDNDPDKTTSGNMEKDEAGYSDTTVK